MVYTEQFKQVKNFFGEHGITSSLANHLANLAKEVAESLESELEALKFVNVEVQLIGSGGSPLVLHTGNTEEILKDIPDKITNIGALYAFNAWMRSAIKAKEALVDTLNEISLISWTTANNISYPKEPSKVVKKTPQDILATWSIAERNNYLSIEAQVAAIGKYIHKGGAINKARAEYYAALSTPREKEGCGSEITVTMKSPSITKEQMENMFMQLQNTHRTLERSLNSLKSKIQRAIDEDYLEQLHKHEEEQQAYIQTMKELQNKMHLYIAEQLKLVQSLKIVVPNELQRTFDYLNSLGKGAES